MNKNARFIPFALGLTASTLAQAQLATVPAAEHNPYYIGASQAFTHESNLFRLPDGASPAANTGSTNRSDTISTTSLLGGVSLPVSRQRLFADVALRHNKFKDHDALDNTGYGLTVGADWATIGALSGTVSYTAYESLASLADGEVFVGGAKNMERSQQFLARGRLGGTALLAVETTYIYRKRDYSSALFGSNEFDQNSLGLGLLYRPAGPLTLGAGIRHSRGTYGSNDDFNRNDFDLTAVWTPSGLSKVAARLSYSDESHDVQTQRDFSGITGSLTWEYKPTGKLTFTTDLIRDTGAEASFNGLTFDNTSAVGNNAELTSALRVRARFDATAKVSFDAAARYAERDLLNGLSDKTANAAIGVNWLPTRSILLGCELGYEKRDGGGSPSYTANTAMCMGRLTLQ